MCLAWGWGLVTLKAAYAARPAIEAAAQYQALQQQAGARAQQTGENIRMVVSELIYDGGMFDTRVTVITYVMCCVFIYALARLRCSNPKLILLQLFGTITIDIFLLIGPSLPTFNSTLAQVLVKPGAVGIGIGAVFSILLFPQSTSSVVLAQMEQLIRMVQVPIASTWSSLTGLEEDRQELRATKAGIINLLKEMEPGVSFLPLDFSRGRWNSDDVKGLQERVRETMMAALSLLEFHIARVCLQQKVAKAESEHAHESMDVTDGEKSGSRRPSENIDFLSAFKSAEEAATRSETVEALKETTSDVLGMCSESVVLVADCIHAVNGSRWIGGASKQRFDELTTQVEETLGKLRSAREICATNTTEAVLDSHSDLFDEQGQLKHSKLVGNHPLRGIILAMVIEERILAAAGTLEALLQHLLLLLQKRTQARIWLPFRLGYACSWLVNGDASAPIPGMVTEDAEDPDVLAERAKETHRRLLVSQGYQYTAQRGALTKAIVATWKWLTNAGGMYAFRMVVVTIATSIPASLPSTAGFFYREKGIWAVVTAQTCMLLYMADFTFSLVSRALGTLIGGVMGMVVWYAGSGNGTGNSYGLAATTAVATLILMWLRLFLHPAYAQATIMAGATFILIVGFSYDHHHIVQYGLPGLGYESFWKRMVTVLIGFVAAFIVQLFPNAPSATMHVRKSLANTVRTLNDHYALLLSHWNRPEGQNPVGAAAEQMVLGVAENLHSLDESVALLKVEVSLGPFNQKALQDTQELCQNINLTLGKLLILSSYLPKELQERFIRSTGFLDEAAMGNIMSVLVIIEQALRTGSPLPERLPAPLVRSCFESWRQQHPHMELSKDQVRDENYRRYCVAMSVYLRFLATVDELVLVLKGALGEAHVVRQWDEDIES